MGPTVLVLGLALVVSACAQVQALTAVTPNDAGEVVFTLTDNRISPSVVKVKAGQTVRFIITNEGRHVHEFMVGQDPLAFDDYLFDPVNLPFENDFLAQIDATITGSGMAMNFMGMDEMEMGEMGEDMAEDGDTGAMIMFQPGSPDDPSQPGQSSAIEFVVPESLVGTWEIGCFREAGQHFADGMRATLIVEAP
jgi:uncharacterized cupredoxin-like copper-binding protein